MPTYYEDTDPLKTKLETQLLKGVPSFPHVDALLSRLVPTVLTTPLKHASARAIVVLGSRAEPGGAWFGMLRPSTVNVRFRTRRNILELDEILQPYYGNVLPGLAEMRGDAIDAALEDYWIRWFRTDSAIYRVYVVSSMCIAAGLRELQL